MQQRASRSIPLLRWSELLRLNGVHFVDLQYGDAVAERNDVETSQNAKLHHWDAIDPLRELDSYAALIKSLDLVITIDNSTAHLAGALGVPVWNLLPFVPDWRWLLNRDDTPWYASMRLFRQKRFGDWDPVMKKLECELRTLIKSDELLE